MVFTHYWPQTIHVKRMTEVQNDAAAKEGRGISHGLAPPPYDCVDGQTHCPPAGPPPAYSPPKAGAAIRPTTEYPSNYDEDIGFYVSTTDFIPLIASSSLSFDDKTVRRAFIRKVFSIVTLQLLVTFSIVCLFTFSTVVKKAVWSNPWIYASSYIVFLVVALSLSLCRPFSRKHPWNLLALAVITLSMSFMVGTVASFHNTTAVVIAMGSTLAISFALVLFSIQNKVDLTIWYGVLLVLLVDLIMFGIFCTFYFIHIREIVLGCLGALLFAVFLTVDCQMVMGSSRCSLDPEEYVFAALILYLDVLMIFLYLLRGR